MLRLTRRSLLVAASVLAAVLAAWGLLAHRPQPADARGQQAEGQQPPAGNIVRQGFPARSFDENDMTSSDSGWEIEWEITQPTNGSRSYNPPSSVLKIAAAKFMYKDKEGKPRWITVLRNLELGESFVPYDPGFPQFRDVASFAFHIVPADERLLGPACVAKGAILDSANPYMKNKVYKEVHDDGLRWLSDDGGDGPDRGRRGEKMLIWAVLYAANYRYIMEYGFADDGIITCRLGATGRNLRPLQRDESDCHLHIGCWMYQPDLGDPTNPDLGGPAHNVVQLVSRLPANPGVANGKFKIDRRPFGTPPCTELDKPALEGAAVWVPEEFTTLRVESAVRKNGNPIPQATSYDLVPIRYGSVRNIQPLYEFANKDFWVTAGTTGPETRFSNVPSYVADPPRPIDRTPVTVWHNSPALHMHRAEDFAPNGVSNYPHVAITAWTGFMLKPRNLFDSTPLFNATTRGD